MRNADLPAERPITLDPARDARVDLTTKGFPAVDVPIPLAEVAERGWSLEDLLPPVLVLREAALGHNIALMADYCANHGVELAPHGKTTMAPQLWRRQLDAGAWGITAATVAQARVMLAAGVPRVLIANEVTDRTAVGWIAAQLRDPSVEILCSVDSPRGVELLAAGIEGVPRPLPVLVELGHPGGRTGCRTEDAALQVARLVTTKPELVLAGATGFEGTICDDRTPACLDEVRAFLDRLAALTARLRTDGLVETEETWVSAGGSAFFDLVAEHLRPSGGLADRVLVRSGRYVIHDAGENERVSPFAHRDPEHRFHSAIEAWAAVLSRPEPELAILGFGRRDVPFDQDLPLPFTLRRRSGERLDVAGALVVERLNDQHAYCRVAPEGAPEVVIEPGDLVGCGVSHACTAFDKSRVIPVLDDGDRVVGAVATYF
jgi:D-serine deaminase-like pyridoxal phosphate-dependent protein